ncbi:subtilase family protein [Nitrosomonas ureae]|uniref:S8 family peptidase n=1 Tax=Nitrosomonas ureae TaxID=44577 RepID=UPI000D77597C|nr:S8 family peptidase [Nitrosomonas ureae]PXX16114.1 subtilase family protein [Nitrosomonas ureae]
MTSNYPHLPLQREEPITEKRSSTFPPPKVPSDPAAHAKALGLRLQETVQQTDMDIGGFDDRRLFRFKVSKGFNPDDLRKISGEIEFVSQEADEVVVAFVSQSALQSFEARLASIAKGESVTNKQVYYALQGMTGWTPDDRTGWSLKQESFPQTDTFYLDLELWPIEDNTRERQLLCSKFEAWLKENGIEFPDSVKQAGLTIYRVRCDRTQAEQLLHHRDIRIVDLPPRFGLDIKHLGLDIRQFPVPPSPLPNAPGVVILDSGLVSGHPLLSSSVGDSQSFLPGHIEADESGHGTHVAGIALYGDLAESINTGSFIPELRLFSGRVLDRDNENNGLIENHIDAAVRYFVDEYNCRVFNLSFGDRRKPYLGGHVRGLAYTLDRLSRELGVLFIVSAGNVLSSHLDGLAWRQDYPQYLLNDEWAIIDPATALNVLTVGSLARWEANRNAQRFTRDPAELPIAKTEQPSPFTRHGPTVGGAIKPELVAFGGNWALNARGGANNINDDGLGELSTSFDFAQGRLLGVKCGTSFAAPHITHLAGKILSEHPEASANLIRALLVAHASIPTSSTDIFDKEDSVRNVLGYGHVDIRALLKSLENEVTLIADGQIENKRHHFYELLVPDDFISPGKRAREISISLAHAPPVRSTRVTYKATRLDYRLVSAPDLDHAAKMFNKATLKEDFENIPELSGASISRTLRSKGTVQSAIWQFRQLTRNSKLITDKLFIVVTRNDYRWGEADTKTLEEYSLVVCLRDRENQQAKLYTQIQNRLQQRQRARTKI